jgi:hypothetical protein
MGTLGCGNITSSGTVTASTVNVSHRLGNLTINTDMIAYHNDGDTGFKFVSDGIFNLMNNDQVTAQFSPSGINMQTKPISNVSTISTTGLITSGGGIAAGGAITGATTINASGTITTPNITLGTNTSAVSNVGPSTTTGLPALVSMRINGMMFLAGQGNGTNTQTIGFTTHFTNTPTVVCTCTSATNTTIYVTSVTLSNFSVQVNGNGSAGSYYNWIAIGLYV